MSLTLRITRRLSLCALLASGPACAATDASAPYGVWRGTLGGQAVMVHLQPDSCDASYYYLRHLWGIRLALVDAATGEWREGADAASGPRWRLRATGPRTLAGEWTDARGQRRLPLQLTQVADAPQPPTSCYGSEAEAAATAYNAPRVAAKAPQARADHFQGHAYQVLSVPGTELRTVQLPATPRPVPRLNQLLRGWLQSEVAALYDCQLGATRPGETGAPRPDYLRTHEPVFWNEHLLVLRESFSYYCGGAYPDAGVADYRVWDLDTDQPVDTDRWLRATPSGDGGRTWPPALKALIARQLRRAQGAESDCVEAVEQADRFMTYPSRAGMVFTPVLPHVVRACADDITLGWRELRAHLSATGAQMLRDKVQP